MTNYTLSKQSNYIFIDWHGVLSDKGFWSESVNTNQKLKAFMKWYFSDISRYEEWMRNNITVSQIDKHSNLYDISSAEIIQAFKDDIKVYAPNLKFLQALNLLFPNSKKYIITDNIDLFDYIYNYYQSDLEVYFKGYFSSHQFDVLKTDNNPSLFDLVLPKLKLDSFDNCLLVDDNLANCIKFKKLKGNYICLN